MTLKEKIKFELSQNPGQSDAQLAERLGYEYPQPVNGACRELEKSGELRRDASSGMILNFVTDADKANMEPLYHIGFDDTHGAKYAIMPGDPGRVEKIAKYLDNARFYHQNREYTTWLGELCGETVMVISTGMGGPSTAICVEELYQTGVRNFIRIGTCGGMATKVMGGDIVIATGAIRMEGTTKEYVPIEFPAVADLDVTNALVQAAKNLGATWHAGIVQCKDSFYGQHSPARMPSGYELEDKWQAWIKAGCLASEMESSTLYIVAQILGARAGCALNVVWNQERERQGLNNPHEHDTDLAIRVTVEAVKLLISHD